LTTMVIRETEGSSVSPTARLSMLNPRAANRVEMRASTPNLFSTMTEIVRLKVVLEVIVSILFFRTFHQLINQIRQMLQRVTLPKMYPCPAGSTVQHGF